MKAGKRTATAAGGVLAAVALSAACGGAVADDPYANVNASPAPPSTAPTNPGPAVDGDQGAPAEKAPAAPALKLSTVRTAALGRVVADGKGWILYRFDKDRAKPTPKSACTGACAQKWPPVLIKGRPVLEGVAPWLVGKVRREDGSWQLTLHGWPVYRFAGDTKPGQWKGQGVGGTWFAIKRTGARNTVLPGAAGSEPAATDGYGSGSDY